MLSPNGQGRYLVGEVTGDYRFAAGNEQPHQRPVAWHEQLVHRSDMSESLRNSAGSIGTVSNFSNRGYFRGVSYSNGSYADLD